MRLQNTVMSVVRLAGGARVRTGPGRGDADVVALAPRPAPEEGGLACQ